MPVENAGEIYEACAHAGFIIRPFPNGVRITVGTREQNEGVISVLQQHFENKKESLEMRQMHKKVVLIGTGLIGGSLALAIKKEHDVTITGYDIFQEQVERAKELHVVDEIAVNLQHACEEAHLIVLLHQLKKRRSYYTN